MIQKTGLKLTVSWSGGREDLGRGRLNHLWRSGGSDAGRAGLWDAFGGGGEAGIGGGWLALGLVTSQDATPVVAIEVVVLPVGTVAAVCVETVQVDNRVCTTLPS